MLKYTLWLLIVALTGNTAFPQLASNANTAQTLLDEAMLKLGELSCSYCVRFNGTHSAISESSIAVMDVQGVSAVSGAQAASYRSWGTMHQLQPQQYVQWREILRIKPGITLCKASDDRGRDFIRGGEAERPEDLKKNPRAVSMTPQLDPFGLVFGTEHELYGRNSDFAKRRDELLSAELLDSTQNAGRNVVGRWIGSNKKYLITIEFDHKTGNMPIAASFHLYDAQEKKVGRVYGGSRTEWQRYGKSDGLVPKKTTIVTPMTEGHENETDFFWTWMEPKKWETAGIDFEAIAKTIRWHVPFDELFEEPATIGN